MVTSIIYPHKKTCNNYISKFAPRFSFTASYKYYKKQTYSLQERFLKILLRVGKIEIDQQLFMEHESSLEERD